MHQVMLRLLLWVVGVILCGGMAEAGTWRDHFHKTQAPEWGGDNEDFQVTTNGFLEGVSAAPVGISPLNHLELPTKLSNVVVSCWVNVVRQNSGVCTKGALFLRHDGTSGYVFALHQATQTVEVYRSFSSEMLLLQPAEIRLGQWYQLRAELNGTEMRFFVDGRLIGSVTDDESATGKFGVAVQDAASVLFDDFSVNGPEVIGNVDELETPNVTVESGEGELTLRFFTEAGFDYILQSKANPQGHGWNTVTNFTVKLQPIEAVITVPAIGQATFYRVEKVNCWCD